jgi:hypothetical protein
MILQQKPILVVSLKHVLNCGFIDVMAQQRYEKAFDEYQESVQAAKNAKKKSQEGGAGGLMAWLIGGAESARAGAGTRGSFRGTNKMADEREAIFNEEGNMLQGFGACYVLGAQCMCVMRETCEVMASYVYMPCPCIVSFWVV